MAPTALSTTTSVSAGFEIEHQWRAHPSLRLPAEIGEWQALEDVDERLVDHYYDTAGMELHERRARLRVRRSHALTYSTLKRRISSTAGLRRRIEIEGPCAHDLETSVAFIAARLLTLQPLLEIGHIITARVTRVYTYQGRAVEIVKDQVTYPVGRDEWRLEVEGDADDVTQVAMLLEQLRLGLAPVRRGKVQTLLHRRAA
jgi:inorganic triphosphatase YgiF